MAKTTSLYLKWHALRELIGLAQSDAQIGALIFGEGREGAPKFSKLLSGDYGCPPEIGAELIAIINRRIEGFRKSRGLTALPTPPMLLSDLDEPLYLFIRKLIAAGEVEEEQVLHRLQELLLEAIAPSQYAGTAARLVMERYETMRGLVGMEPSGGPEPFILQVGRHRGRLAVLGVNKEPAMAYTFLARDPRPAGYRSWDLGWNKTVLWLPSPSRPRLVDGVLLLMPEPADVLPDTGRFIVTTVLLWDAALQDKLDPRGAGATPSALDEQGTTRFLTNLRRLAKRQPEAVTTSRTEYHVAA
jgi:hypothetical protein